MNVYEERFFSRIAQMGDDPLVSCWEWRRGKTAKGYGTFSVRGVKTYAHRYAYELFRDEIPEGLHIDHLCRNRACCNPWHLEPVTAAENYRRGEMQQRRIAAHAARTACKWGHEWNEESERRDARGNRYCRLCSRRRTRESWARKKAMA